MKGGSTAGNTAQYGGGVHYYNNAAITKTGGIIYGSNASPSLANTVTGTTNPGAAVYVGDSYYSLVYAHLENTVSASHNLFSTSSAGTGAEDFTAEKGWYEK
jgi:hypothetical protein